MKKYPDIKDIIKNKAAHRRSLAALSFEEKIEIVFRLQDRKKLIKSGQAMNQRKPKVNKMQGQRLVPARLDCY